MKTNGSEHAFPHLKLEGGVINLEGGLTKREYFAAMAMQGLLGNSGYMEYQANDPYAIVEVAIKSADALIKEISQPGGE